MTHWRSDRGAALLEMAMVTPVLLVVLAGIVESGLLFRSFEVTVNAAREGARLAVLPGAEQNNWAVVRTRVNNYLLAANLTQAGDPTPPTITITTPSVELTPGVVANGVRVTVTYEYDILLLEPLAVLFSGTFAGTLTYQSSAFMRTHVAAVGL